MWLQSPQDETEELLRNALDQAKERTGDEITHRRVWARVASPELAETRPKAPGMAKLFWACASLAALVGGGFWAYSTFRAPESIAIQPPSVPAIAKQPLDLSPPLDLVETERVPGQVVQSGAGEKMRVALGGGAEAELFENSAVSWDRHRRPMIKKGKARLSVPHQPPGWRFSVSAGPYLITVVGTKFDVDMMSRTVRVAVTEGIVEVGRGSSAIRLHAGDSWEGPLPSATGTTTVASVTPPPSPARSKVIPQEGLAAAHSALDTGDTQRAIAMLAQLSKGEGPTAENAAYDLARVTRDFLHRPRQAIQLWEKYRRRFPSGVLRKEADLSIVETLVKMDIHQAALTETEAFLARYPNSERRTEMLETAARLRATLAASAAGN